MGNNNNNKSQLEKTILRGIHGTPELKREEKNKYLGEFRERVIKALTIDQVHEQGTYPEILEAIRHPKANKLVISRKVDLDYARDYIQLARDEGLSFKTVASPSFKGDVGLVVVSDEAVDIENIGIPDRAKRLLEQGLPENLVKARGNLICDSCFHLLEEKAPEELNNYRKLNLLDKIMGKKCTACSG